MLKKVNISCYRPFSINGIPFAGNCVGVILDSEAIKVCIENKALVEEVLLGGKTVPLDFNNYNTENGISTVPESAVAATDIKSYSKSNVNIIDKTGKIVDTVSFYGKNSKKNNKQNNVKVALKEETAPAKEEKKEEVKTEVKADIKATVTSQNNNNSKNYNNHNNNKNHK